MADTTLKQKKDLHKVLDRGFVKLIDFMGGDQNAVDSARVSFGSVSKGEALDRKLIEYLLANGHLSPFEHSVFQFHVKCPIFVARQWMRHRIASYNEISARYTKVQDEFYFPEAFRAQDNINRQGSVRSCGLDQEKMLAVYDKAIKSSYAAYQELIEAGAAREMARLVLPVAQYTQFHWTINARSLLNFISLRADAHAQYEIRQYADAIQEMFCEKMPWTWKAYAKLNAKKHP
ncbi:MAG: FAD-dependent thymidylate synthase [Elusimicrobia bacterium GWA2_61_42]|nr:MAG: FAD-dependent thymidylate synthase [Elusimicrobia bacterium GWA2_61_42]OGR80491.1 MAG: FAD-dependent thymidylate synthase [Elusimicrobia bacterium GWC2_61_25]